jgi:hypothetical protein
MAQSPSWEFSGHSIKKIRFLWNPEVNYLKWRHLSAGPYSEPGESNPNTRTVTTTTHANQLHGITTVHKTEDNSVQGLWHLFTHSAPKKKIFIYICYSTTLSTVQVIYRRLIRRLINKEFEQKVEGKIFNLIKHAGIFSPGLNTP